MRRIRWERHRLLVQLLFAVQRPDQLQIVLRFLDAQQEPENLIVPLDYTWRKDHVQGPLHRTERKSVGTEFGFKFPMN